MLQTVDPPDEPRGRVDGHWRLHIVRHSLHPVLARQPTARLRLTASKRHIHRCHFRCLLPCNRQTSSDSLIAPHLTNQPQQIPCRNPATTSLSCRLNNTITAGALHHPANADPFRTPLGHSFSNQRVIPLNYGRKITLIRQHRGQHSGKNRLQPRNLSATVGVALNGEAC